MINIEIINPKFFELNCRFIIPSLKYEEYLIEVLNASTAYFSQKHPPYEKFESPKSEDNGECDANSSEYSIDFKLLIDESVMNAMAKNIPSVDYSTIQKGYIRVKKSTENCTVPNNNILFDLMDLQENDIQFGNYSSTVKHLLKNLQKNKNLFLFYPYQISTSKELDSQQYIKLLNSALAVIMEYRTKEQPNLETFVCIKVNRFFLIYEWTPKGFVFRDQVYEGLCSKYKEVKLYSLY